LDKQQRELIGAPSSWPATNKRSGRNLSKFLACAELYAVFVFKKVARDPGEPGEKAKRQRSGNDPCPE